MVAVRSGLPSVAIEVRDHHSVREPSRVFAGQEVRRFLVSGVLIVFAGMILPEAALSQSYPFDHLVVFGDSVSDTGNGTLIWGQGPHSAIPQNNYSNNRYTDGVDTSPATAQAAQIWTDRLAAQLRVPAPGPSLASGTNYATYGSNAVGGSAQYPGVDMQVQQAISKGVSPTALYLFWGGANDILSASSPNDVTPRAIAAANGIATNIAALANAGARYFVWINMPPFQRVPDAGNPDPAFSQALAAGSVAYNNQQSALISQLKNQFAGSVFMLSRVDMYALFSSVLDFPGSYGFANATDSAAGASVNPDTYFFWKEGHFTTTAHVTIAGEVFRSIQRNFLGGGSAGSTSGPANGVLDFNGDGRGDLNVWRGTTAVWYSLVNGSFIPLAPTQWGLPADVPVPGDYDGDHIADIAVWRPFSGTWFVIPSRTPSAPYAKQWGLPGDAAVPGDYDGDGRIDFAVWRPSASVWHVLPSSAPGTQVHQQWGLSGDLVAPADYDGDGKTDYAVWRPSNGYWFIQPSSNPAQPIVTQWGFAGDTPVPGDYDGDGRADLAVYRESEGSWYVRSSRTGALSVTRWGLPGDIPVYGDFDGDGKADIAIWRPADGNWYYLPSSNPAAPGVRQWGLRDDTPL